MKYLRPTKRIHKKNQFQPIVDGETAFKELLDAIRNAKRFIYIATWNLEPEMELTRSGSGDPTLGDVLLERAKAGVEVKVLTWDHTAVIYPIGLLGELFRPDIRRFKKKLESVGNKGKSASELRMTVNPSKPRGRRLKTGSDHQKFWQMDEKGKRIVGFLGGLNLGQHEWDTSEHKALDNRRSKPGINRQGLKLQEALKNPIKRLLFVRSEVEKALNEKLALDTIIDAIPDLDKDQKELLKKWIIDVTIEFLKNQEPSGPRHDIHSRMRGPVIAELIDEFRHRWKLAASTFPNESRPSPKQPKGAKTTVQIGHTAYFNFSILGARQDILKSYLHAVRNATKYIYMENQYFVSPKVAQAIAKRVREVPGLRVIILLPNKADEFAVGPAIALRQLKLINVIKASAKTVSRKERVHLFSLARFHPTKKEYIGIYIHAKIAIIDDRWMTIGSANTSARSFELDSELNAFLDDKTQAKRFRNELWSEHLEISKSKIKSADQAIKLMLKTATDNGKKKSGALKGRLIPLSFTAPHVWLQPFYETIADEFL
ncbi:MAG: hypothetical protein GY774_09875 [Planctomycetes bacterium]|nr:hypothetical protein [Planctomycetota bacterium]